MDLGQGPCEPGTTISLERWQDAAKIRRLLRAHSPGFVRHELAVLYPSRPGSLLL
jgi:hypothetical protein